MLQTIPVALVSTYAFVMISLMRLGPSAKVGLFGSLVAEIMYSEEFNMTLDLASSVRDAMTHVYI